MERCSARAAGLPVGPRHATFLGLPELPRLGRHANPRLSPQVAATWGLAREASLQTRFSSATLSRDQAGSRLQRFRVGAPPLLEQTPTARGRALPRARCRGSGASGLVVEHVPGGRRSAPPTQDPFRSTAAPDSRQTLGDQPNGAYGCNGPGNRCPATSRPSSPVRG